MYLTKEYKKKIFSKYGKTEKDTGSCESQIALISNRITHLTTHLQNNKKDYTTRRSLVKLVGKRKSLVEYLRRTNFKRYAELISKKELGIKR